MTWDQPTIHKLTSLFSEKHEQMFGSLKIGGDRKNRSAIWNKYIKHYDIKIVRNDVPGKSQVSNISRASEIVLSNLIEFVNLKNDSVANSLIIRNPDRYGQWLLIPRDMAERILVIGMI
jgi:hypothetical protein